MIRCPKCQQSSDFNQDGSEIVLEKCGHTFELDYIGTYDDNDKFHDKGVEP